MHKLLARTYLESQTSHKFQKWHSLSIFKISRNLFQDIIPWNIFSGGTVQLAPGKNMEHSSAQNSFNTRFLVNFCNKIHRAHTVLARSKM